jgi:hypothetical protein
LDNTNDDSLTTPLSLMINEIDEITIISGYIVNIWYHLLLKDLQLNTLYQIKLLISINIKITNLIQ